MKTNLSLYFLFVLILFRENFDGMLTRSSRYLLQQTNDKSFRLIKRTIKFIKYAIYASGTESINFLSYLKTSQVIKRLNAKCSFVCDCTHTKIPYLRIPNTLLISF